MFGDDQFNPGKLEEEAAEYHNKEPSPPLLLTMNAERHKPAGEIDRAGAKGLERFSTIPFKKKRLETLQVSSFQKATPLPTVVAGLDLPREPSVVWRPAL